MLTEKKMIEDKKREILEMLDTIIVRNSEIARDLQSLRDTMDVIKDLEYGHLILISRAFELGISCGCASPSKGMYADICI